MLELNQLPIVPKTTALPYELIHIILRWNPLKDEAKLETLLTFDQFRLHRLSPFACRLLNLLTSFLSISFKKLPVFVNNSVWSCGPS